MSSCTSIPCPLRRNRNGVKPHKVPVAMAITKQSLIKDLNGKKTMMMKMMLMMTNDNTNLVLPFLVRDKRFENDSKGFNYNENIYNLTIILSFVNENTRKQ